MRMVDIILPFFPCWLAFLQNNPVAVSRETIPNPLMKTVYKDQRQHQKSSQLTIVDDALQNPYQLIPY
ncbi:hypothetical protein AAHE18_06G194200 [Arachis hypogaea]